MSPEVILLKHFVNKYYHHPENKIINIHAWMTNFIMHICMNNDELIMHTCMNDEPELGAHVRFILNTQVLPSVNCISIDTFFLLTQTFFALAFIEMECFISQTEQVWILPPNKLYFPKFIFYLYFVFDMVRLFFMKVLPMIYTCYISIPQLTLLHHKLG